MKNSNLWRRVAAGSLTLALALMAAGCGDKQASSGAGGNAESGYLGEVSAKLAGIFQDWEQTDAHLTDANPTFTYWVINDQSSVVDNYADLGVYKTLKERTGVNIEFIHPTGDQNQLDMLIAANTLPDFVERVNMNSLPGGADKNVEDGVILRLNELIAEHAPNFSRGRELSDEARRLTITDEGNLYGFPKLLGGYEGAWGGPSIRADLLEKLNLDVPETFDDWYDVLTAFKQDGIEIPLSFGHAGWDTTREFGVFIGGFDVNKEFYVTKEGSVSYGPIDDGYFRFLSTFHKWYEEGLIAAEFDSLGRSDKSALAAEGKIGAAVDIGFGEYITVPAPYPVENAGDKARFRQHNWRNRGYEAVITSSCQDPELAVKWFDYHYSPEGSALFSMGVLGESYEIIDDEYVYTPAIYNDPNGVNEAMRRHRLVNAPFLTNPEAPAIELPKSMREERKDTSVWDDGTAEGMLPTLTMTVEERERFNELMEPITPFVSEYYVKFIKGEEALDKWDEYVRTIRSMGIDEAIAIQQAAYTRMMNR